MELFEDSKIKFYLTPIFLILNVCQRQLSYTEV